MVQSRSCNVVAENIVVPSVSEVVGKDAPVAVKIDEVTNSEVAPSTVDTCKDIVDSEVSKEPVGEDATEAVAEATVSADAEDAKVETKNTKIEIKAKDTEDEDVATNEIASGEVVSDDMIAKEEPKRPLADDETSESSKKLKAEE